MKLIKRPKNHLEHYVKNIFQDTYSLSTINNKKIIEMEDKLLTEKPTYDVIKTMINKRNIHPSFKKITSVYVDPHACERWNERVGPFMERNELISLIKEIIFNFPERITMESEASQLASIDGDIIFGFKIKKNALKINTFYGRKSLNLLLNDIDSLRIFNRNQNDKINLEIDSSILETMKKPLIPSKYIHFNIYKKDNKRTIFVKSFVFNIYSKKENKIIPYIYFCYNYGNNKKSIKIKDYPLVLKKMNKMSSDLLFTLMLLNMHGSILMYITKYENDEFSKKLTNMLREEL